MAAHCAAGAFSLAVFGPATGESFLEVETTPQLACVLVAAALFKGTAGPAALWDVFKGLETSTNRLGAFSVGKVLCL